MELEKGKITMVIPLYNKVNSIKDTLESVIRNHGNCPFECIIVDDSSTDGSDKIAMEYEKKYPELFTYLRIQHKGKYGPANARNVGIRYCNSEFICFLDADDEILEGFIDRGYNFFKKFPYIDIYGENHIGYDGINETIFEKKKNIIISLEDMIDLDTGQFDIPTFWACIYKTEQVRDIMFTDNICEDTIFILSMLHRFNRMYIDYNQCAVLYKTMYSEVNKKYYETYNVDDNNYDWFRIVIDTVNDISPDFPYYFSRQEYYDIDEGVTKVQYNFVKK